MSHSIFFEFLNLLSQKDRLRTANWLHWVVVVIWKQHSCTEHLLFMILHLSLSLTNSLWMYGLPQNEQTYVQSISRLTRANYAFVCHYTSVPFISIIHNGALYSISRTLSHAFIVSHASRTLPLFHFPFSIHH